MLILVYYPLEPGEYVPIVFLPGLEGVVPPDLYSDTLEHLASHGYVVVSMDTVVPSVADNNLHKSEILAKKVYEEIQWVRLSNSYIPVRVGYLSYYLSSR